MIADQESKIGPETGAAWVRPRLIVLSRGTPEESVLSGCKAGSSGMSGPKTSAGECAAQRVPRCQRCNAQGRT